MQKSVTIHYNLASMLSLGIVVLLTWGFYNTYLIFFPAFDNFVFAQHFHGIMMMVWMILLIVQPLLISTGRVQLHHIVGKSSFVIAPLLVVSIFLVSKMVYERTLATVSETEALAQVTLSLPGLVAFAVLYACAMINRKHPAAHMRFMIGTSLLMVGPGLGRALIIYYGWTLEQAVDFSDYLVIGIVVAMLLSDRIRKKPLQPNSIVLTVIVSWHLIWELKYTSACQAVMKQIVAIFF